MIDHRSNNKIVNKEQEEETNCWDLRVIDE